MSVIFGDISDLEVLNFDRDIWEPSVGTSLDAELGSYSLSGSSVSFLYNRLVSLDNGQFTLTGNDIGFANAKIILAQLAQYVLSGIDIELRFNLVTYQRILESAINTQLSLNSHMVSIVSLNSTIKEELALHGHISV